MKTVSEEGQTVSIGPGALYVVATPIGNLEDLSPRACAVLKVVDTILAEDTRMSQRLLRAYGISKPLLAYHEHNERQLVNGIVKRLRAGEHIALISNAGTPLISDPGFHLIRAAHEAGVRLFSVPGPCAAVAALAVSGLPSDRFVFEGFLPAKMSARQRYLQDLRQEPRTMIFYETPHRLLSSLTDMAVVFGPARRACLAKEITKVHETIYVNALEGITKWLEEIEERQKGEFVIVVEGLHPDEKAREEQKAQAVLEVLLKYLPLSQASAAAAEITGIPKNMLYRLAIEIKTGR